MTVGNRKQKNSIKKIVRFHTSNDSDFKNGTDVEEIILPKARVIGKMLDGKLNGYCIVHYNDGSVFRYEVS